MTSVNGSYYNDFIRGCQDETLGKIVNFLWREIFGECVKNMEVRDALYIIFGYLLGSILFARLGGLIFKKTDIMAESGDLFKGFLPVFLYRSGELPENPLMLSFVMAAPVLGHILPFYDIKHGGKGIAATFGCFLGLLPHWIPLCVLASIFIFFSCVVKINPNYYRTVATYILAAICTVWLEPNRYIVFGFLLIAASVLAKLFMSAEEKEHFEVKLAWKH